MPVLHHTLSWISEEVNEEERKTDEPPPPSPGISMFPVDYGREGPDSFVTCIWV